MTTTDPLDWLDKRIRQLAGSRDLADRELRSRLSQVRIEVTAGRANREVVERLAALCPCLRDEEAGSEHRHLIGPLQECPVHGDGVTFVSTVQWLSRVREAADTALDGGVVERNALVHMLLEGPVRK